MTARYQRNPNATWREIDASMFLANPDFGVLYRANETTRALWRLLEVPLAIHEAIRVFQVAFPDQAPEEVAARVEGLFDELIGEGLVDEVEPEEA